MEFSASPYARALGSQLHQLHPSLQSYFSGVAPGRVGIGEGNFERIGTRRRWLVPFLRPLQRLGVLVAGWHTGIPLRVENRVVAGRAVAKRTLRLPGGDWTMHDSVGLTPNGRLVDSLGAPATVSAAFDTRVADGAVLLRSRAVGLRLGRLRVWIPGVLSPVVRLREARDSATEAQRVDVTIDLPLIGRVYEYGGTFTYRIEEDER
ncbi:MULTISPECIES: DUF4166 domain-containing protein [unclassified Microbacterium]|uniref:DUF4166 domain-containing protein n=1 Tax=unclassified Microbacterium TaxID=2609290 RepID=UPI0012FAE9AA|nr:DUF4166 domain-containing protein [Microbacterium sp. MAH-37]MVQ41177.1 DUF4166 domain-containing protein [Microbacterium sp. MAH-37]